MQLHWTSPRWARMTVALVGLWLAAFTAARGQPAPLEGLRLVDVKLGMAATALRTGKSRRAMAQLRDLVREYPQNRRAKVLFLKAMAQSGLCGEADEVFATIEGTWFDGPDAHLALGRCAEQIGAWDDALAHYRLAGHGLGADLDGTRALAALAFRLGEVEEAEAAAQRLLELPEGWFEELTLRLEWAVLTADPRAPELLQLALRDGRRDYGLALSVAALSSVDDCRTYQLLGNRLLTDPTTLAAFAECLRRRGEPAEASRVLARDRAQVVSDRPELAIVSARILADLGEHDAASDALVGLDDREGSVLASRTYVALRRDGPDLPQLRARWAAHPVLARMQPEDLSPAKE